MKKFTQPFDAYALTTDRPMSVELHPQGIMRYVELANNPIYYLNAIQYTNGSLYRAVLGYEKLWDEEYERNIINLLDHYLSETSKKRAYYFEDIEFTWRTKLWGYTWRRGIKPTKMIFDRSRAKAGYLAERGRRATARVNFLDKPHHVDIEFENGDIFTVSFWNYLKWKQRYIRSLSEGRNTRKTGAHEKNSERRKTTKAKTIGEQNSVKEMAFKLFNLRQRIRRSYQMSKTHTKI